MQQQVGRLTATIAIVLFSVTACDFVGPHPARPAHYQNMPLAPGLAGEQSRWVRLDTETGEQQFCTTYHDKVESDSNAEKAACGRVTTAADNDPLGIRGSPTTGQVSLDPVDSELARRAAAELKLRDVMRKCSLPRINSKGWQLMVDKNEKYAYVSPDRQHFEEVECGP
jgi:hypothetical protein